MSSKKGYRKSTVATQLPPSTHGLVPNTRRKFRTMSTEHGVKVSPAKARELIKLNLEKNRNITKTHMKTLSASMKAGNWMETGEPIIIDQYGRIIDGQHRLYAVIDSGITITATITYGVDPAAFDVMGTGKTRNLSDAMSTHGIDHSRAVTAAYRVYGDLQTTTSSNFSAFGRRTRMDMKANRSEVIAWVKENNEVIQEIMEVTCAKDAKAVLKPASLFNGFYFYLCFQGTNPDLADEFFENLIDGVEFEYGKQDPIYQLRKRLMEDQSKNARRMGTRVPLYETMAVIIKAYNAWVNNQKIRNLRFARSERWPEIDTRKTRKS